MRAYQGLGYGSLGYGSLGYGSLGYGVHLQPRCRKRDVPSAAVTKYCAALLRYTGCCISCLPYASVLALWFGCWFCGIQGAAVLAA
jgi:hypothetical protein